MFKLESTVRNVLIASIIIGSAVLMQKLLTPEIKHTAIELNHAAVVFVCPPNIEVSCIDLVPAPFSSLIQFIAAGGIAISDCSLDTNSFTFDGIGSNVPCLFNRFYTITDNCSAESAECEQTVTILDVAPPIVSCPGRNLYCNDPLPVGDTSFSKFLENIIASGGFVIENCGIDTTKFKFLETVTTYSNRFPKCLSTIELKYGILDFCGNEVICRQPFTFRDTLKPTFTPVRDTILYLNASCMVDTSSGNLGKINSISDDCGVDSTWYTDKFTTSCNNTSGTLNRIWRVKDNCGNIAIDTQFIKILDTIRPTVRGPRDTTITCSLLLPAPDTNLVTGTDNCSMLLIKVFVRDTTADSTCVNNKRIIRIYTVSDQCQNVAEYRQVFTIKDTIPPAITCPANLKITCTSNIPPPNPMSVTAMDNCDANITIIFLKDSVINGSCINKDTVYRIYSARDTCANTKRCVQSIIINDTVPPTLTCPTDLSITCVAQVPTPNPNQVMGSDNCTGMVTLGFLKDSITNQLCANQKIIHRIYTGIDVCLNLSRCIQKITIDDRTPPTIVCPANITVQCTDEAPIPNPATVMSSDNCGGVPMVTLLKDSVPNIICVNKKTIYRIYQAADSCFNLSRCIQIIVVNDTISPTLVGGSNTVTLDCNTGYEVEIPTAVDNCDAFVPVTSTFSTVDSLCPGTYKIVWVFTAKDSCNNMGTRSDTVSYLDDMPPTIMCPPDKNIECTESPYSTLDSFMMAGGFVEDLCGLDSSSFALTDEYFEEANGNIEITRTYSITDLCGMQASCQQTLTTPGCFTDLALKKYVNAPTPYFVQPGDKVPICVVIYNQGLVTVDSIKLIEYFPSHATKVLSPGWIDNGNGTACRYLSQANGLIPMGGFLPGDTLLFCFDIQLGLDVTLPESINRVEINEAKDLNGRVLPDIDSTPDDDPNNDSGGVPNSPDDDKVDGDSRQGEDEDDSDPTVIYVCFPLNCIAQATVSFDALGSCTHCLLASEVLKGRLLPDEFYLIEIFNSFGVKLPSNCIGREYLGQTLTYSVSAPGCSANKNSCWGKILMEDKSPPAIDCSDELIYCTQISSLPSLPNAPDNCSGSVAVTSIKEVWVDYGCDSPSYYGVVIRTLTAKDDWNNRTTCDKKYFIRKVVFDEIVCPTNKIYDCTFNSVTSPSTIHPDRTGSPTYNGVSLWPAGPACHLYVNYTDQRSNQCGNGIEIFRTWVLGDHCTGRERKCIQIIKVIDLSPPTIFGLNRQQVLTADPHDCVGILNLPLLSVSDCNNTTQTYIFTQFDAENPNVSYTQSGPLPAKIKIPVGLHHKVKFIVRDDCGLFSQDSIYVDVYDLTPPTPLCTEYTQVTLDPDHCWAQVAASSLDAGSTDNCCTQLHYAAAFMDDVDKARSEFKSKIETECGKDEYWNNKSWYERYIDEWINCYVFKDTIQLSECGTRQVILRVYEACDLPRYDPHVFPCSPHAWFCYNTSWNFRIQFNKNFNKKGGNKDCGATGPWACKSSLTDSINASTVHALGFYQSLPLDRACDRSFGSNPDSIICKHKLYNDCMIQVLADDKRPPVCDSLTDIHIYCDMVPSSFGQAWSLCTQNEVFSTWPLDIKRSGDSRVYGYYGGSLVKGHDDHELMPGCGYSNREGDWSPIYCRAWLELDRYDAGQRVDSALFSRPVIVDKKHPKRPLLANEFLIKDNCIVDSISYKDEGSINTCGEGWLQRTWRIRDKCGNISYCSQKIIVKHRSDFEVLFPADKIVDCTHADLSGPDQAGRPIVSDDDCEQVGVQFKDDTFDISEGACYKIVRTWTLIDACIYESSAHVTYPDVIVDDRRRADESNNGSDRYCVFRNLKDNGDGFMRYIQIIKVIDTIAPKLTCKDTTFCIDGTNCSYNIDLSLKASDNCASKIWFNVKIDKDGNGSIDEVLTHVDRITGTYTPGKYVIEASGYDHCDNVGTCTFTITVKDCKAPTPYCINGVATVIMPSSGSLEVWASDLNLSSSDNCTPPNKLIYSFDPLGNLKSRVYNCTDISNGKSAVIPVDIWVIDEANNKDVCKTYIKLQDNGTPGICPDNDAVPLLINLSGTLSNEAGEPIENVDMVLSPTATGQPQKINSTNGQFHFPGVSNTNGLKLAPHKDDDAMNGVSTLDLILIEKHIKGELRLNSPYKMVAADVNRSGDIDIIDLIELRKLILGLYDKLPSSESWRFIPRDYKFKDLLHPFDYPMSMNIINEPNDLVVDFTGLKVGDVNSTAAAHKLMGTEIRSAGAGLVLQAQNLWLKEGETVDIPFSSPNFRGISGLQGTLHTNGLKLLEVKSGSLDLSENNLGRLQQDLMTISWHHWRSLDYPSEGPLFILRFKAIRNLQLSESLWIGSDRTKAESYQGIGEIQNLSLEFTDPSGTVLPGSSALMQNYPNPFTNQTTIGLRLETATHGVLSIIDISGRVIKRLDKNWPKGYQEIIFNDRDIKAPGIYFYQFESNNFTERKKMIFKP